MNLACLLFGHRWRSQHCTRCDAWRTVRGRPNTGAANVHHLKVWPQYFDAIVLHGKRFEVRKADRNYQVGDRLVLNAWDPMEQAYTGHGCNGTINYIMPGGQHGIAEGYAVIGFKLNAITHHYNPSFDALSIH